MKSLVIAVGLFLPSSASWPVSMDVPVNGTSVVIPITTPGDLLYLCKGFMAVGRQFDCHYR